MALVKWRPSRAVAPWSPFDEFDTLRREIDRAFGSFWDFPIREMAPAETMWAPRVDFMERDDEYVLRADLPGMKLEDIEVQYHEGTLTLKGERKMERESKDGYHRQERVYGTFFRSFALGAPVDAEHITATYKDGVLEVHVPKTAEARPKHIPIKAS